MSTNWLQGFFGLVLFAASGAAFVGGCGDDEPESAPCQENSFQCVGQELQKCVDGTFVMEEVCMGDSMCRAEHGHCHPGGEGGHHEGGMGGHHMGGMHMGGAGGS